jgi:ppGpp synthetase/RelA/SpoT-type nucleotidyltranferase
MDRALPIVNEVQRYVAQTLTAYTEKEDYIFRDREKRSHSLSEKLESGRYSSWNKIDDLYACRIVVPTHGHESAVVEKLNSLFAHHETRSRNFQQKSPDVFRFDSLRWYGTMREDVAAMRQPGFGNLIVEVQVLTAFEFAWLTVSHDLVYKADRVDWSRDRLAAHLKAAVEQIEVLIASFEETSAAVLPSPWPQSQSKSELIDRFKSLITRGQIPPTLQPDSWRRFADNVWALVSSYERDSQRRAREMSDLAQLAEVDLTSGYQLPLTGSLFQYVISLVARPETRGNLRQFTVVPSRELRDFYGVMAIPKPFEFEGDQD